MKLVFVADLNSPITHNWVSYFVGLDDQVSVISLYPPARPAPPGVRVYVVPHIFSGAVYLSKHAREGSGEARLIRLRSSTRGRVRSLLVRMRLPLIYAGYVAPLDTYRLMPAVQRIISELGPDLVHGLRTTHEGAVLGRLRGFPVVVTIWGNDLTLFAANYPFSRANIRRVLGRTEGLMADCGRDIRLASHYGFQADKPTLVVPTAGGVRSEHSPTDEQVREWRQRLGVSEGIPVVLNPRGTRPYVRNREYLQAIPQVLQAFPDVVFVSAAIEGDVELLNTISRLGIAKSIRVLPTVSQVELAALFQISTLFVSPSVHDGTPNSLLEGMANGAVPLAGDLESIREWIKPGQNGLLFDATNPADIASAICQGLENPEWRLHARSENKKIVMDRADYNVCMGKARDFYAEIIRRSGTS